VHSSNYFIMFCSRDIQYCDYDREDCVLRRLFLWVVNNVCQRFHAEVTDEGVFEITFTSNVGEDLSDLFSDKWI
jgi:hypothetical protein